MLEESLRESVEEQSKIPNRRKFLAGVSAALLTASAVCNSATAQIGKNMPSLAPRNDKIDFLKKYPTSLLESAIYLLKGTHEGIVLTRPGIENRTLNAERLVGYAGHFRFLDRPG